MNDIKLTDLEDVNGGSKVSDAVNGIVGGIGISWSGVAGAAMYAAGATATAATCGGAAIALGGAYLLWNAID